MKLGSDGKEKATIRDVAKLAGVSIKTVSRVTNNHPNVRDETRLRVQNAIAKLNYSVNPYARYLGSFSAGPQTKYPSPPIATIPTTVKKQPTQSQERNIDWW